MRAASLASTLARQASTASTGAAVRPRDRGWTWVLSWRPCPHSRRGRGGPAGPPAGHRAGGADGAPAGRGVRADHRPHRLGPARGPSRPAVGHAEPRRAVPRHAQVGPVGPHGAAARRRPGGGAWVREAGPWTHGSCSTPTAECGPASGPPTGSGKRPSRPRSARRGTPALVHRLGPDRRGGGAGERSGGPRALALRDAGHSRRPVAGPADSAQAAMDRAWAGPARGGGPGRGRLTCSQAL